LGGISLFILGGISLPLAVTVFLLLALWAYKKLRKEIPDVL
jgi:uncharacterized membrane protein YbaN (DUF454 family)